MLARRNGATIAAAAEPSLVSGIVEINPFTPVPRREISALVRIRRYRRGLTLLLGTQYLHSLRWWLRYLDVAYPSKPADYPAYPAALASKLAEPGRMAEFMKTGKTTPADAHAINPLTSAVIPAMMAYVAEVEVVVAHSERATLRVGDVFLKIDADQTRIDVEVEAMALAPIPKPEILWRKPPALALAALPGTALGHLGEPSTASPAAWAAAGAAIRTLHDAPSPPWPSRFGGRGPGIGEIAADLHGECEWLVANGVLPADLVTRNRQLAETALRPWTPVFIHGDLQVDHVFVDDDEVTGVVDWSEAGQGDALFDIAILTLGHREHLDDVVAGYGIDLDRDLIRAWWSLRCLTNVRWLAEHGYGSPEEFPEVAVLRSQP